MKKFFSVLNWIFYALAMGVLFYFLFQYQKQIADLPHTFPIYSLAIAFFLLLIHSLYQGIQWRFLLKKGLPLPLPFTTAYHFYLTANLLAYIPGRLSTPIGIITNAVETGLSKSRALLALFYFQIYTFVSGCLYLLLLLSVSKNREVLGSFFGSFLLLLFLLIGCGFVLCHPFFKQSVFKLLQRIRKIESLDAPWEFKTHLLHIGYCFFSWLLFGSAVFVLVHALNQNAFDFDFFWKIHFLAITCYLLGRLVFLLPAGLGITEGSLVFGLSQSMPMEIAVWTTVLFRILVVLTLILTWGSNFFFYNRRKR